MKTDKVSIIIPTHNRRELLTACLKSISNLSYDNHNIIIVDDASEDETSNYIISSFPHINLIRNTERKGAAYCKNQGLLKSDGQFVWFLDSDSVVLNRNCLNNMINFLQQDHNIGCIGGQLVREEGRYLVRVDGYEISKKMLFDVNTKSNFDNLTVRSIQTCNLFTRRELLLHIGGFDTDYRYLSEDTDVCIKIHALGYRIVLDHRTLVLHEYSKVSRKSNYYLLFRNEIRCSLKNRGVINGFLCEPLRLFRNIIYAVGNSVKEGRKISDIMHNNIPNPISGKSAYFLNLCWLGANVSISFVIAYIWNILWCYKTVYIDNKIDYLKKTVL